MTQSAYNPMRKAEKHVSQEDMWAKLAKHAKPEIAVATAQPELSPLVWLEPVKTGRRSGYVLTACGGYSVSKDDSGTSISYTAWKCKWGVRIDKDGNSHPKRELPDANLGCVATREEAEKLCEAAR